MKEKITLIFIVVFGFTSLLKAQIPTDSLILYLPFNGNTNDESGFGHNGINKGATLTSDRFGTENSAYLFDGDNDYIQVINTEKLNSIDSEITISSWVKANSRYYNTILSKSSANILFQLAKTLRPGVIFSGLTIDYGESENYYKRVLPHNTIPENKWIFVATTFSSIDSTITIYINDSIVHKSQAYGNIIESDADLYIGYRDSEQYSEYFDGAIDDIRIYNKALDSLEIISLYQETFGFETIYDTIQVFDTTYVTVYDTITFYDCISVTDILIIDVVLTGLTHPNNVKTIQVYPNPASEYIIISTEDYSQMSDYNLKIVNTLGQTVYENLIDQAEFQINVNDFGGYGSYFIKIFDDKGTLVVTEKLILQ